MAAACVAPPCLHTTPGGGTQRHGRGTAARRAARRRASRPECQTRVRIRRRFRHVVRVTGSSIAANIAAGAPADMRSIFTEYSRANGRGFSGRP